MQPIPGGLDSLVHSLIFGGAGAAIKSIQRGTTTLAVAASVANVTISAVDLARTFVHMSYSNDGADVSSELRAACGVRTKADVIVA